MNRHAIVGFIFRALLILGIISCSSSFDRESWQSVEGYWEGSFMPESGLDLVLVIHFYSSEDQQAKARVLLWQNGIQIQDDPLSNIKVKADKLSFYIGPKDTPFEGTINLENQFITGQFTFPDGTIHPATVRKVAHPSLADTVEPIARDPLRHAYPETQIREDFSFLRQKLETIHPALYRHSSKDSIDAAFSQTSNLLQTSLTEEQFFRLLGPLVARIRCAHTAIRPSDGYERATSRLNQFLPLIVKIVDGRLYHMQSLVDTASIEAGSELLSINGVSASDLLNTMMASLSADGDNETYKLFQLNRNFSRAYATWIDRTNRFDLTLRSPGSKITRLTLPAASYPVIMNGYKSWEKEHHSLENVPASLEYLRDLNTAKLTITNFGAPDPEFFIKHLADVFAKLNQNDIGYLVLDVQGNTGGMPLLASELLSYLSDSTYTYFRRLNDDRVEFPELYEPVLPKANRFRGAVYVLMDGGGISSTGHFLSMVKVNRMATLVGQESGGTYYCNDASVQFNLPNSGIRVNIPQRSFQTTATGLDNMQGIIPDHQIKREVRDLINGTDPEMDYTLRLIRSEALMHKVEVQ